MEVNSIIPDPESDEKKVVNNTTEIEENARYKLRSAIYRLHNDLFRDYVNYFINWDKLQATSQEMLEGSEMEVSQETSTIVNHRRMFCASLLKAVKNPSDQGYRVIVIYTTNILGLDAPESPTLINNIYESADTLKEKMSTIYPSQNWSLEQAFLICYRLLAEQDSSINGIGEIDFLRRLESLKNLMARKLNDKEVSALIDIAKIQSRSELPYFNDFLYQINQTYIPIKRWNSDSINMYEDIIEDALENPGIWRDKDYLKP